MKLSKWLCRVIQWSDRQEHDVGHDETIHDTVASNQRYFAFIRPRTPRVYRYLVISRIKNYSPSVWLLHIGINRAAPTVWQLGNFYIRRITEVQYGRHRRMQKAKFWFGNGVPKQWTLFWFLQHTNANTIYIQNNETSQQLKYCIWIKCFNVWHIFQASLRTNPTTVLMVNHRRSAHCIQHSPSINGIFRSHCWLCADMHMESTQAPTCWQLAAQEGQCCWNLSWRWRNSTRFIWIKAPWQRSLCVILHNCSKMLDRHIGS